MFFSIIIPAFNAERFLPDCLASVDAQSFNDYEVIIIDDGSIDKTTDIVDYYSESKENVKVVHQSNAGLLLARRVGLKQAQGIYVVFLDSDDCLHPEALQCIYNAISETNADIISFRYTRRQDFRYSDTPSPLPAGLYSNRKFTEARNHLCSGRFHEMWGKAIRRNLFDISTDYSTYGRLMHGEDLLQMLPVFDKAHSLCSLNDILYFYRPNDIASTSTYKSSQLSDIRIVNRIFLEYAQKWGNSCYQDACAGEALQYINLLKIAVTKSKYQQFIKIFLDVREAVQNEKCMSRWERCKLRIDNKLIIFFLKQRLCALTFILLKAVNSTKKYWRR